MGFDNVGIAILSIAILVVGFIEVFVDPFIRLYFSKQRRKIIKGQKPDPIQEKLWETLEDDYTIVPDQQPESPTPEELHSPDFAWTFYKEEDKA